MHDSCYPTRSPEGNRLYGPPALTRLIICLESVIEEVTWSDHVLDYIENLAANT